MVRHRPGLLQSTSRIAQRAEADGIRGKLMQGKADWYRKLECKQDVGSPELDASSAGLDVGLEFVAQHPFEGNDLALFFGDERVRPGEGCNPARER